MLCRAWLLLPQIVFVSSRVILASPHSLFFPPSLPTPNLISAFLCPFSNPFPLSDSRPLWSPSYFWNFASEMKITVRSLAESICLHEEAQGSCAWLLGVINNSRCLMCKLKGFLCGTARSHCGLNIFLSKCPCEWVMSWEQEHWILISPVGWMWSPGFLSYTCLWGLIFHIVLILWDLNELSDASYQHELVMACKVPLTDLLHFIMS